MWITSLKPDNELKKLRLRKVKIICSSRCRQKVPGRAELRPHPSEYTGCFLNHSTGTSCKRLETDNNSSHTGSIFIYQRALAFSWVPWDNDYSFFPPIISPLRITSHLLTLSKTGHQPASIFKPLHLNIGQTTMPRHRTVPRVWIGEMPTVSSSVFSIPWLCFFRDAQLGLQSNTVYPPAHTHRRESPVILCGDINAILAGVSWE